MIESGTRNVFNVSATTEELAQPAARFRWCGNLAWVVELTPSRVFELSCGSRRKHDRNTGCFFLETRGFQVFAQNLRSKIHSPLVTSLNMLTRLYRGLVSAYNPDILATKKLWSTWFCFVWVVEVTAGGKRQQKVGGFGYGFTEFYWDLYSLNGA